MADILPIYVLASAGPSRERLLGYVGGNGSAVEPASFLLDWKGLTPGLVLADPETVTADQLLSVLRPLTTAAFGWIVALVGDDEPPSVRILSLAPGVSVERVVAFARDRDDAPESLLELQQVLGAVSRVRHDLNNPLTSALAEVQLMLMDAGEGDMREALEVVQAQLRRIRDLIASTGYLKPTRS